MALFTCQFVNKQLLVMILVKNCQSPYLQGVFDLVDEDPKLYKMAKNICSSVLNCIIQINP